jgi:hypothetical protein
MKVRHAIALGALSLIGSAVYAAPTGDAADYYINREIQTPSTTARSQVKADVRQARVDGQLRAAGEAESYAEARLPQGSDRARAEVKAEVLAARAAGELVPAGEGVDLVAHAPATGRFANLWSRRHGGQ